MLLAALPPTFANSKDGAPSVLKLCAGALVHHIHPARCCGLNVVLLKTFLDSAPQFAGVTKQLITYARPDSVQLSGTLYLPAGYDKTQGPLPFLLWAYPQEFKSASAASQVRGSPYRFTRPDPLSPLFVLTQGYGVLDGPTMPIVGAGDKEPNDSYIPQLVADAKAFSAGSG